MCVADRLSKTCIYLKLVGMCFEMQVSSSPSDSMMSGSPQRFQVISTEPATTPQRIQVTSDDKEWDPAASC